MVIDEGNLDILRQEQVTIIAVSSNAPYTQCKLFFCFFLQLVGAAFGAAGQRCMALSTAIFVGESKDWISELTERAKKLKVDAGKLCFEPIYRKWR